MKIKLATNARRRLAQVREYHSSQGDLKKGKRVVRELIKHAKKLIKQPEMGVVHAELSTNDRTYRSLIVNHDYKIIYRVEDKLILIVEIFDVRQDPSKMRDEK